MIRRLIAGAGLSIALTGCQSGGGSSLPQSTSTASSATGPQAITVSIKIPSPSHAAASARRKPLYVSQNTQSASISVNGGSPVIANLSAGSPNCTPASGTGRICTVALSAPAGTDTFSESLYANATATGTPLSENTTTARIVPGKANVIPITLDGVVNSIALSLGNAAPPAGSKATIPLAVDFDDASGAAIIGDDAFENPIALSDSDTSGATTLSKTTLNSPADAAGLTVAYTGAAIGSAVFGASAAGVSASNITPATLSPVATPAPVTFNDWPGYGYDVGRSGYNPNSTAITPASLANLHLAWQIKVGGATQTQPIVVTGVPGHAALLVIANFAIAQAYDGVTGARVWSTGLPVQDVQDCGIAGISGTAAYDKALGAIFMAAGNGNGAPNHTLLYRLDAATGAITGSVDVTPNLLPGEANYSHAGITFANGRVYVGTGSDCEGTATGHYPSWRGRVAAVDPSAMTLLNTFYTTWLQHGAYAPQGNYGGGGVWGWGGVSSDPSGNVYVGTGNAENLLAAKPQVPSAPFTPAPVENAGYADQLVKLSSDLSTVEGSDYPNFNFAIGYSDLDYSGTPTIFAPPVTSGCGVLSATQGKGGKLVVNNTSNLSEINTYDLSVPSGSAYYIGNPAFSPATGYLYAAITSSGNGSAMLPPGLAAIGNCGSTMVWHAQFGPDSALYNGENPRSAPTVTAGGVVFIGTPCTASGNGCGTPGTVQGALWAIDATNGTVLGGGNPLVITGDNIRMAPSVDGQWLYLLDDSGNFYGYTLDPTIKAAAAKTSQHIAQKLRFHQTP